MTAPDDPTAQALTLKAHLDELKNGFPQVDGSAVSALLGALVERVRELEAISNLAVRSSIADQQAYFARIQELEDTLDAARQRADVAEAAMAHAASPLAERANAYHSMKAALAEANAVIELLQRRSPVAVSLAYVAARAQRHTRETT